MLAGHVVPVRPARVLLHRRDQFVDLVGALDPELDAARMAAHHARLRAARGPGQNRVDKHARLVADHPRVYGGIFDEGSPQAGSDGFRADVLAAVRDLGVTNVRWPGGEFAAGYHRADGIGPDRPRRAEPAWRGEESNR